jgi:hypothetical protein
MGIETIVTIAVVVVTAALAVGGLIWMLKNHEHRLSRTEDRLAETDKRVNNHDILFEVLKLDLDYMKKGIDKLQEGQEAMANLTKITAVSCGEE